MVALVPWLIVISVAALGFGVFLVCHQFGLGVCHKGSYVSLPKIIRVSVFGTPQKGETVTTTGNIPSVWTAKW